MPAEQSGYVTWYRGSWCARWYDEHGKRKRKRGFRTKTDANRFLRNKVDEVARLRRGEVVLGGRSTPPTMRELVDEFLAQYTGEGNSKATLESRLKHVLGSEPRPDGKRRIEPASFCDLRVDRLTVPTVAAWRKRLPEASGWHIHKALRQVLNYAVAAGYTQRNVARDIPNPEPKRSPVDAFRSTAEIDALAAEFDKVGAAIVVFASETGLRTEEWLALERKDVEIDRETGTGVVHVARVYVDGQIKEYGKTEKSIRTVPLTARAIAAFDSLPPRLDTPILFPGDRHKGSCGRCPEGRCLHIDLASWRQRKWSAAIAASGLDVDDQGRALKRTPYSLRHTYATWMLASNVPAADVADFMGTSLEQLEKTYRHRTTDALERARQQLEAWQKRAAGAES